MTIDIQQKDLRKKDEILNRQIIETTDAIEKLNLMTTNCHRFENIILELKEEKNIIQEQLRSGDDSARVLEEYKKRAQLALKKVIFRE